MSFGYWRVAASLLVALTLESVAAGMPVRAEPPSWSDLRDFADDDHVAALKTFVASCPGRSGKGPKRPALAASPELVSVCAKAKGLGPRVSEDRAHAFFEEEFVPRRIGDEGSAFFTGYYEPVVDGALSKSALFTEPLYAPPDGLVRRTGSQTLPGLDASLNAGRRLGDGTFAPLPDRAAVDAGALAGIAKPLLYVHDPVEAFFIHIQGSARIRLPAGSMRRLAYAGRNGYPYTSIGKVLVQSLHISPEQMGLTQLKDWIRDHGQGPDDAGTRLMQRNRSYIFFSFDDSLPSGAGPVGGSGISLTALRSLAIDRTLWPFGLPFYVDADLPWQGERPTPFRRILIGQDTGSAILGKGRADIFFGSGPDAARLAGPIRHPGTLFVLWPKGRAKPQ